MESGEIFISGFLTSGIGPKSRGSYTSTNHSTKLTSDRWLNPSREVRTQVLTTRLNWHQIWCQFSRVVSTCVRTSRLGFDSLSHKSRDKYFSGSGARRSELVLVYLNRSSKQPIAGAGYASFTAAVWLLPTPFPNAMMTIALITIKSSLVPLIEGLCAQI